MNSAGNLETYHDQHKTPEIVHVVNDQKLKNFSEDEIGELKKIYDTFVGILEMLKNDPKNGVNATRLLYLLEQESIPADKTDEVDDIMMQFIDIEPFGFMVPFARLYLGLSITTNEECEKNLLIIKNSLSSKDYHIIESCIDFLNASEDVEFDTTALPQRYLLELIGSMNQGTAKLTLNCIEYMNGLFED